jgi:hypothetical protein
MNAGSSAAAWRRRVRRVLRWWRQQPQKPGSSELLRETLFVFHSAPEIKGQEPDEGFVEYSGQIIAARSSVSIQAQDRNVIAAALVQVFESVRAFDNALQFCCLFDASDRPDDHLQEVGDLDLFETEEESIPGKHTALNGLSCWVFSLSSRQLVGVQSLSRSVPDLFLALEWHLSTDYRRGPDKKIAASELEDIRRRLQWIQRLLCWCLGTPQRVHDTVSGLDKEAWDVLLEEWLPLASPGNILPDEISWKKDPSPELVQLLQRCSMLLAAWGCSTPLDIAGTATNTIHWVAQRSDEERWGSESPTSPLVGYVWVQRQSPGVKQGLDSGELVYSRRKCWHERHPIWAYCLHAKVHGKHLSVSWLDCVAPGSKATSIPNHASKSGPPTDRSTEEMRPSSEVQSENAADSLGLDGGQHIDIRHDQVFRASALHHADGSQAETQTSFIEARTSPLCRQAREHGCPSLLNHSLSAEAKTLSKQVADFECGSWNGAFQQPNGRSSSLCSTCLPPDLVTQIVLLEDQQIRSVLERISNVLIDTKTSGTGTESRRHTLAKRASS